MFGENNNLENDLDDFTATDSSSNNDKLIIDGLDEEDDDTDFSLKTRDNLGNQDNYVEDLGENHSNNTQSIVDGESNYSEDTSNYEDDNYYDNNVEENTGTALTFNANKKIKVLIGNGRPGLGKSTCSLQLIAPYLFIKSGQQKIPLYTFESLTDTNMFSTHILDAHSVEVRENSFDNVAINIVTKDEYAIYDIGGGKTTQIVMESLKNTGLIFAIDLFVIPLTDGKHEALKAKEFYDFIKEHNKGAKIVFVLNKVAPNACYDDVCLQYIDFLGDRNLMVDATRGIIEDVAPEDRNLVHLYNDDIIKYSVRHEESVFEIAFKDTTETDRLLLEAMQSNDSNKQRFLSARKTNIAKAKKYYEMSIQPSMQTFDRLLGLQ